MPESLDGLFAAIETDKLPSLPHVLLTLLDASHTEVMSFDRLSDVIKRDAALTSRIVGTASTAFFGGQGKSLTFERTLVLLGLDTIKTIAITASVQQFFSRFDTRSSRNLKKFWGKSLTCAVAAREIAKLTGYANLDEAYIAGLLHNIGELIFYKNYPDEYPEVAAAADDPGELLQLESAQFGGNHCQAGAWLISQWQLDSFMADAVLYQGEPINNVLDAQHLVKILYVASRMSRFDHDMDNEALVAAERLFDLSQPLMRDIARKSLKQMSDAASSMGIEVEEDATQLDSETKQVELAERVKNIALLDGVRQQLVHSEGRQQIMLSIQKGMSVLFSASEVFFFMLDHARQVLAGSSAVDEGHRVGEIEISVDGGMSLLVRCLQQSKPLSSFDQNEAEVPTVVDRQIIKLSGKPGITCLPMAVDKEQLGVLVVGAEAASPSQSRRDKQLLSMFANEASYHLHAERKRRSEEQARSEEDQAFYEARAREIVHEVNNPLAIIKNYVHILGTKLDSGHAAQEDLTIIREELERAGNIMLRLPGIAEKKTTGSGDEITDINRLIADLLKVFRASLFASFNVESFSELDDAMEPIVCDRNALKQILTNLVKNAAEAVGEGGRIVIKTRGLVNQNGKNYVAIVVEDNGPGIPPQIQAKLFTPVTTTKGKEHSGLGLSIVKNLLQELDGSISCRSDSQSGARFEILIPRILGD